MLQLIALLAEGDELKFAVFRRKFYSIALLNNGIPFKCVFYEIPDGYDAYVKVMVKQTARIEVDELDHASFTYEYYENQGTKKGLSNAANVVHSEIYGMNIQ